jgi:hypothetical protein
LFFGLKQMQTDLSIRLRAYADTIEPVEATGHNSLYTEALASSHAASAAASAAIISSHTRILRGDSPPDYLLPGQDELDILVADKPSGHRDPATGQLDAPGATNHPHLPLHPGDEGNGTLNSLVLGAPGILAIKNRNA